MNRHLSNVLEDLIPAGEDGEHRRVVESFLDRTPISRKVYEELEDDRTFGERLADRVAAFGGSWYFIMLFAGVLLSWVALNSYVLIRTDRQFDPYPYILLNLFLSMLAAVQAPIILMSQNRQAAKDRAAAEHDYEVNLRAELEVRLLHEKMDDLRQRHWEDLIKMQERQIEMLERLLRSKKAREPHPTRVLGG